MRPIKFRVWDNEEKTMEIAGAIDWAGDDGKLGPFHPITVNTETKKLYQTYQDDPRFGFVLMQFTGLKDKNGKEIYEGDIVRYRDDNTQDKTVKIANVFWSCAADWAKVPFLHPFAAMVGGKYLPDGRSVETVFVTPPEACEVIGNVHENPELLTEIEKN